MESQKWSMKNREKVAMELLIMGFPEGLAAQAVAATGGQSTFKATEWILSNKSPATTAPSPPPPPNPCPVQPKLNRFFNFQSKHSSSISPPTAQSQRQEDKMGVVEASIDDDEAEPSPVLKRPRLPVSSTATLNGEQQPPPPPTTTTTPSEPLSERMRPRTIDEVVGQDHLLSRNTILRSAVDCNRLPSIIFWGPPGTGKTSIAKAIVNSISTSSCSYRLVCLSAVASGVKDVRNVVDDAKRVRSKRTVLFIDEVHRFSKSQQDSFLPFIEDGSIVFMGATTENPSFHLATPLLSRCRLLTLSPLTPPHLLTILRRAVADQDKGLCKSLHMGIDVSDDAIDFLSVNCDGDARVALNALEIAAATAAAPRVKNPDGISSLPPVVVSVDDAKEAIQCKHVAYDRAGEEHYNLISALHKSMRGSDADASIYWLARMLEGGEQPLYIARRLIRFAGEDVGLADPLALNQAVACYQACHFLGMPECNVVLAQCVAYLALSPKSVSVYEAIEAAQRVVRESVGQNEGVPLHLRNAPTKLMKDIGYGKGYIYTPHDPSSKQSYLPSSLEGYKFLHLPTSDRRGTL